jgi:hypothetical protein
LRTRSPFVMTCFRGRYQSGRLENMSSRSGSDLGERGMPFAYSITATAF